MNKGLRWLAGLALALASAGALALGLGEIEVKSGPGEPFLAEIPIIASDPTEIDGAQARLASPETFARVGLAPPQGLVDGLRFEVTRNAHGHAVVRVSSAEPVDVPSLSFLIEVDWGRGRLVREYSALVDAPRAAEAAQPIIETPMPLPPDTIPRLPAAAAQETAATREPATATAQDPAATRAGAAAADPASRVADPPARSAPDGAVTVAAGQTLFGIARDLQANAGGASLPQWMIGMLRANPQAFADGNINRLRAGAVLRVPERAEVEALGAAEAQALVREHIARWRQARAPLPQPADTGATPAATAAAPAPGAAPGEGAGPGSAASGARLQIAPAAAAGAERTAIPSGADAGTGDDMLTSEQLRQAREDLATRDAEMQELRTRVAELERLQQQQAQLIEMKDDDLAAAQQRLAQQQAQSPGAALPAWSWAVLLVFAIAVAAAWALGRRRKPSPFAPPARGGYDSAALAAAMPARAAGADTGAGAVSGDVGDADADADAVPRPPAAAPVAAPAAGDGPSKAGEPLPEAQPAWHRGDPAPGIAPLNPAPAGRERLELAVAYLDLGDVETARDLLREVAAGDDPAARDEAARLLRDLG